MSEVVLSDILQVMLIMFNNLLFFNLACFIGIMIFNLGGYYLILKRIKKLKELVEKNG